jgi:site-specific DNA-methyltransferase (adenine-specific)
MIINQDCITAMRKMPSESVHACITSPPYFGLCDYQIDGQYGHEATLAAYLGQMSEVFSEVYRLLVEGGCCWIVIGDSSNNYSAIRAKGQRRATTIDKRRAIQKEQPEKAILNVPVKLGMRLEADGWIYRNNLIWDKGTCGTIAKSDTAPQTHEYILQLGKWTKGGRPYLNCESLKSSVIKATPVSDAVHPCPFPVELAQQLIAPCTQPGQTVLDPFAGTGSTIVAAEQIGREAIGIELNPEYCAIAQRKTSAIQISFLKS